MVFSTGCRGISALVHEHLLPLHLLLDLGVYKTVYYRFFPPHCCVELYPLLNTFSQRHHQHCWWAQLCPTVCPLELTGIGCVQHGGSLFSQRSPMQHSHCQNIAKSTQERNKSSSTFHRKDGFLVLNKTMDQSYL